MNESIPNKLRILAVDLGTSSVKGCVAETDESAGFRVKAHARAPFTTDELDAGAFRPESWESAFGRLVAGLPGAAEADAISLSGNGPTLVPLFTDGSVGRAMMWHERVMPEASSGPDASPGLKRGTSLFLPKAAALAAEYRDREFRAFLSCPEYLAWILSGELATWLPDPAYAAAYWTDEECALFGLDPALFPPFIPSGSKAGTVTRGASDRFGLRPGTRLVAGGPDFLMAILGTGTVAPGMACDCAGTSEAINVCARPDYLIPRTATVGAAGRESLPTGAVSLLLLPHIIPPYRNLAAMLPATGRLFERYRRSYVPEEGDYRGLVERLARLPFAASASVFPAPPAKGPDGRGGSGARDGDWNFASEAAAPDEIGRAVLEAIGFTARMGIDLLGSAGLRPAELRVSGGQSRNEAWNRLKADLAGIPLAIPELPDGELSGDLCAALVALGEASSFKEAASRSVRIAQTYEPDQAARGANEDAYRRWLERGAREEGEGS